MRGAERADGRGAPPGNLPRAGRARGGWQEWKERLPVLGVLVAAIVSYTAVRAGFLFFSLHMESAASLRQAVDQHSGLLMVVDELLMVSALMSGCAFFNARERWARNGRTLTGLTVVSFALMLIAWVVIVLGTGRLVYPVNGLPVITDDGLQAAVAEIYGAWHLCDITLGVFMISWAGLSSRPLWKYSGAAIGLAQILSTYFGQPVKPVPMLIAIALSTAWMLMRGVSSINGLESEAVQEAE